MTWVSELRFLVCTGKITALYEVVVRLPGGDVGFDKGKPVLGSSCCTREPWGAPDHTSRTPQKSLRICQGGHLHPEHCDHPTSSNLIFIKDKNFHLFCSPLYSQCLGQRRREMRKRTQRSELPACFDGELYPFPMRQCGALNGDGTSEPVNVHCFQGSICFSQAEERIQSEMLQRGGKS
ncbi:uncharacterized protein LOC118518013 isoform X3 [Halichoerus grypus]|uniref:uncharacterized protein LOC118518013 isoform X3 n=1 Tax=Halichoerus grypus TaxID=9711 RepID=UPI00165913DE|nr:uncharacterized protein LOC118518013 isoform X3 [Halichoerus grypus]